MQTVQTIKMCYWNPNAKEICSRDVQVDQVVGCIAIHKARASDRDMLTHIPTGRAILAFYRGTGADVVLAAAKDFDKLLADVQIEWSDKPGSYFSASDELNKAAGKITEKYIEYWMPVSWGDIV